MPPLVPVQYRQTGLQVDAGALRQAGRAAGVAHVPCQLAITIAQQGLQAVVALDLPALLAVRERQISLHRARRLRILGKGFRHLQHQPHQVTAHADLLTPRLQINLGLPAQLAAEQRGRNCLKQGPAPQLLDTVPPLQLQALPAFAQRRQLPLNGRAKKTGRQRVCTQPFTTDKTKPPVNRLQRGLQYGDVHLRVSQLPLNQRLRLRRLLAAAAQRDGQLQFTADRPLPTPAGQRVAGQLGQGAVLHQLEGIAHRALKG